MKKKDKERISENLNREIVLEFAAYLIINMYEAKCAADALMVKKLFGQARSMGILALEEFGKIGPTLSYLSNPAGRPDYVDECFGHKCKQVRGYLLMSIVPALLKRGISVEDGGYEDLGGLVRDLEKRLDVATLEREVLPIVPQLQKIMERGESGAIEEERQDGFYVSYAIDQNDLVSVRHPHMVSKEDAQKTLDMFAIYSDESLGNIFESLSNTYASSVTEKPSWDEVISMLKAMVEDMVKHLYPKPELPSP